MDHFSINVPVQERVWKVLTAQNTSFSDSLHSHSAVCGRHLSEWVCGSLQGCWAHVFWSQAVSSSKTRRANRDLQQTYHKQLTKGPEETCSDHTPKLHLLESSYGWLLFLRTMLWETEASLYRKNWSLMVIRLLKWAKSSKYYLDTEAWGSDVFPCLSLTSSNLQSCKRVMERLASYFHENF